MLVNCQLVGEAHEGQPGFTLVLLKGGFAPRMHLEKEQLSEVLSAVATPTAPLALEATADPHFEFFSMTPLPLRTGASKRPKERRSEVGIKCQLSMPSRLPKM